MKRAIPYDRFLGRVFGVRNSYREPDVYRVVGMTKARLRVQEVVFANVVHHQQGGSCQIDKKWLADNPIDLVPISQTVLAYPRVDFDDKNQKQSLSIKVKGELLFEIDLGHDGSTNFNWCEY